MARNLTMNLTGGAEPVRGNAKMITANLLDILQVRPVLGRSFTRAEDRAGAAPVALISYGLWQSRFAGAPDVPGRAMLLDGQPATIVGVLPASFRLFQPADVYVTVWPWLSGQPPDRTWHPGLLGIARLKTDVTFEQAQRELDHLSAQLERAYPDSNLDLYVIPYEQYPDPFFARMYQNVVLVVRTAGEPAALAPALRDIVREVDRNQPVVNLRTMDDVMGQAVSQPRFRTVLLGLFAAVALVLAAVGVYGLLAHGVAQRHTEFGVRLALGASPGGVTRMVVREGLRLTAAGLAAGLVVSFFGVRLLASELFGITVWDRVAWGSAVVALAIAALVACWLPARRAVKVDPAVALRV